MLNTFVLVYVIPIMRHKVQTIQHEAAWKNFEKTGILVANEDCLFCEAKFRFAYEWISQQMIRRIGTPPEGVSYPVWAWFQWEGKRGRRDLRYSGYAKRGTPMVQIAFDAEENDFLLSDFDSWHCILNNSFLANSEAEWDNFYNKTHYPTQHEIEPSWQRVFDLTQYEPGWDAPPEQKSIQATLWQIKIEQVKKVEHFIAK